MAEVKYILGHSPAEARRLMHQSAIIQPVTERLLREAGLGPGMRVLDVGCGVGCASSSARPGSRTARSLARPVGAEPPARPGPGRRHDGGGAGRGHAGGPVAAGSGGAAQPGGLRAAVLRLGAQGASGGVSRGAGVTLLRINAYFDP